MSAQPAQKYPASPLGQVKIWLSAHVWSTLSFCADSEHSGLRWGLVLPRSDVDLRRFWSGYLRRRHAELHPQADDGTGAARNHLRADSLRWCAVCASKPTSARNSLTADLGIHEEDVELICAGGVKQYFDPAQKKRRGGKAAVFIDKRKASPQIEIEESARCRPRSLPAGDPSVPGGETCAGVLPSPRQPRTGGGLLQSPADDHAGWWRTTASRLEEISEERRQLLVQKRLHGWMHTWLLVHVPPLFRIPGADRGSRGTAEILIWLREENKPPSTSEGCADTKGAAQRIDLSLPETAGDSQDVARPADLDPAGGGGVDPPYRWCSASAAAGASWRAGRLGISRDLRKRREVWLYANFGGVPDKACLTVPRWRSASRQAHRYRPPNRQVHCAECRVEHRGRTSLAALSTGNCTACHSDIAAHHRSA